MTDEKPKGPCGVCGGGFDEHEGKAHVFSEEGRLETQEQYDKRIRGQAGGASVLVGPPTATPNSTTNGYQENPATRLAEVMAHKGLIDDADLLYVIGMRPAPWLQEGATT
jgi:hypothetical protein